MTEREQLLHDLSNAIQIAQSFSSIAYSESRDPTVRSDMLEVKRATERMVAIVEKMKRMGWPDPSEKKEDPASPRGKDPE